MSSLFIYISTIQHNEQQFVVLSSPNKWQGSSFSSRVNLLGQSIICKVSKPLAHLVYALVIAILIGLLNGGQQWLEIINASAHSVQV